MIIMEMDKIMCEHLTEKLDEAQEKAEPLESLFLKPTLATGIKKKINSIDQRKAENEEQPSEKELKPTSDKNFGPKFEISPTQKIAEKENPLPYKEPPWSGIPSESYSFEVIKNGVTIENIPLSKPFLVVGRQSSCDIILEHPTISRYHCVIQYRSNGTKDQPQGFYVFDLDSTHGTFQNKYRLLPKKYNRVRVGHILKFGGSTRMFILEGPEEDQEPETEETVTELKALAEEKKKLEKLKTSDIEKQKQINDSSSDGIDWGMGEDAQEEDEAEDPQDFHNPFALGEELFLEDPKKTLRGWFQREGHDLPEYQVQDLNPGDFRASVELPISDTGKKAVAVVEHRGKKKEAVVQCALEACRMLDRLGMLRQPTHESHEKKKKDWSENDYYDSDEDEFLDRTGDIERKRQKRMTLVEALKGSKAKVETYDSLTKRYTEVSRALEKIESELKLVEDLKRRRDAAMDSSTFADADELEAYMTHLSSQLPDKHKRIEWKVELVRLRKEEARLRKLVNLTRPLGVSELPERIPGSVETKKENLKVSVSQGPSQKRSGPVRVHSAFLEDEEETKPKLRKVTCDDDDDDVRPVPYSQPQKPIDVCRELARRRGVSKSSSGISGKHRLEDQKSSFVSPSTVPNRKRLEEREIRSQEKMGEDRELEAISDVEVTVNPPDTDDDPVDRSSNANSKEDQIPASEQTPKKTILGPTLPSSEEILAFSKGSAIAPKAKATTKKTSPKNSFDFDEKYESWVPPKGQTGDGRTALNDKLGY